jgi:hypothetical protein
MNPDQDVVPEIVTKSIRLTKIVDKWDLINY